MKLFEKNPKESWKKTTSGERDRERERERERVDKLFLVFVQERKKVRSLLSACSKCASERERERERESH